MSVHVLLIAPSEVTIPAVELAIEQINNTEGLQVWIVRNPVTLRTIDDAIRMKRQPFDVVNILAHGQADHIRLDGERMDVASLLMIVEAARCELVVLESCSSVALANEIVKRTRASCMATIVEQGVARAREVNVNFLRALATGLPPATAFMRTALHDPNSIYLHSLLQ